MKECVIIGAGPAGLYAAFLAGLRQIDAMVVESLDHVGGQLMTLYPEKYIYDIPGFPHIRADAFIEQLYRQYEPYAQTVPLFKSEKLLRIEAIKSGYRLYFSSGQHVDTHTILLTSGAGSFTPRQLPGIDPMMVSHSLQPLASYQGQDVIICGGGDTALDYAQQLLTVAASVHLVHRRELVRGLDTTFTSIQDKVNLSLGYEVVSLIKDNHQLTMTIASAVDEKMIHAHAVIVCYGFIADIQVLKHWQLTLDAGKIVVDQSMQTSLKNVYASGGNVTYQGKAYTIASGFGEVNTAMDHLLKRLRPGKFMPYSSQLKPKTVP